MARLGRRYPVQPVIRKLTPLAVPSAIPPVPPPHVNWRTAAAASLKRHVINRGRILQIHPAVAVNPIPRVRRKFTFTHDEDPKLSKSSRAHQQQVAKWLNRMIEEGELRGTPQDPAIGYVPADPTAVGTTESLLLSDTLDRIIAAIKALNGTGI